MTGGSHELELDRELLERLQLAQRTRRNVAIEVTDCLYGCCSRPASRRAGYLQVYRGVIQDLTDKRLILHSIAVASLNYHVIAELRNVEDVHFDK